VLFRSTASYYVFDYKDGRHWTEYSPGTTSGMERQFPGNWDNQWGYFMTWVHSLKANYEAPDLWSAMSQETRLAEVASAPQTNNEPFTSQEQSEISSRLQEIKRYMLMTQQLSQENAEFVANRLDYLEEASTRQGRQDWLHTAIGVLFTIVVGVALAPNAAAELFRFFTTTFSSLLSGTRALP
jgi:hypothetical protein